VATDLRVSLTDRCNLRCQYCMPAEGLDWLPRADVLTDEETLRLIRIGVTRLGITTVRLTGGEPLLRRDLEWLVASIADLDPAPAIALTTNGIGLAGRATSLAAAGLTRINVSLDTLDPQTFKLITRRPRLADVLAGVEAAVAAGLQPVKINTVLLRGVNDHEAYPLLEWALRTGVQLRFIEQMPLDAQHAWDRESMVSAEEVRERLSERFTLTALASGERGSAPAERFLVDGGPATVGIIASVSEPFCAACDRTRLTADGQVRNCLFSEVETDLRGPLREGASDEELAGLIQGEMWRKKRGHGIGDPGFRQPDRPMSSIGG
jgi:cyclic pyranopterin phosphate synthase